jgi:hypothetical protein
MKNLNLKTTKTLIYIIAILLLFGACKPEPIESNPTITYHRLKTEQLNKTPYFTNPDFDTLTYLSNKGDTLIFAKLKTDTTWYYIRTQGAPGVTLNEDYYQTLRNTYQTIKGNGKFEVRHGINPNHIVYTINNISFTAHEVNVGYDRTTTFKDTITVNSITYLRTVRITNNVNYGYVNTNQGLCYVIDTITNNYLQLLNN